MKTTIFCCALTVSLGTSLGYAQSVEELLGLTVPGMQAPPAGMPESSHTTAEESPFYVSMTINPLIQGNIHIKDSTSSNGANNIYGNQIKFDVGVGVGVALGYRIPDTYIVLEVSSGFLWNQVSQFNGTLQTAGVSRTMTGSDGHLYQVPILFSGGLEFEMPGGWPFLNGGVIRFGPSVGVTYYDLSINDIERTGVPQERYSFGNDGWVFAYGAFLTFDLFVSHNVALSVGYQFMGTAQIDYGGLKGRTTTGVTSVPRTEPDMKTNFTYINIVKCGVSIYF